MTKTNVTSRQLMLLSTMLAIGISLATSPGDILVISCQTSWLPILLAFPANYLVCILYRKFSYYKKDSSFNCFIKETFGSFLGTIIIITYVAFLILTTALILRVFMNFLMSEILPKTPIHALLLPISLLLAYASFKGIKVIIFSCEIMFVITISIFSFACFALIKRLDFYNLLPLIDSSVNNVFHSLIILVSYTSLTTFPLLIFKIFPLHIDEYFKSFFKGVSLGLLMDSIIIMFIILILGPEIPQLYYFPGYVLAKEVSLGDIVERSEVLIVTLWFFSVFIASSTTFDSLKVIIKNLSHKLGLKDLYIISVCILLVYILAYSKNVSIFFFYSFFKYHWYKLSFFFFLFIPSIGVIINSIKFKHKK